MSLSAVTATLSTSVTNYRSPLRNVPEERRHRSWKLSEIFAVYDKHW